MTAGESSTCTIELQQQQPQLSSGAPIPERRSSSKFSAGGAPRSRMHETAGFEGASLEGGSAPSPSAADVEDWNRPRRNIWRVLATFTGFVIMGLNDAAYGALIPYLETYYHLSYTVVSLIFLSPLVGYTLAALLNNKIHMRFGQRGVAIMAPSCHLLAYIVIAVHPPYPVLIVVFSLAGMGNGLEDGAWNAWIGSMARANQVLGLLHGFYGLGGVIAPLIATTMVAKANLQWYTFYYLMIGCAAFELWVSATAFWSVNGRKYRDDHPRTGDKTGSRTKEALTNKVTWICAAYLFIYTGVEVSVGGWVVTFMIEVRHGSPFASGMCETGYWLGIMFGRIVLGFLTPVIGEKLAIVIYLLLSIALQLVFYLVPSFMVSAVAVSCLGFFMGPMFPAAVVAATKLLPKHLHVSAVAFAAAFGGGGAAAVPFAVGAIAQAKGVQVLPAYHLGYAGGMSYDVVAVASHAEACTSDLDFLQWDLLIHFLLVTRCYLILYYIFALQRNQKQEHFPFRRYAYSERKCRLRANSNRPWAKN